jgi:hypothetical protein
MPGQIAPSSRIIDIAHLLPDPIGYVTGVVSNFVSSGYDPNTSVIRLGITGRGKAPNYKIEEPSFLWPLPVPSPQGETTFQMTVTPNRTFSGPNHREMFELEDLVWHTENWSTDTTSFAELKALLTSVSEGGGQH